MEGIVVGIVGSEGMLGNGGKVTFGMLGMAGKLGSGGSVGLGRDGWVVGKVGNVGWGRVGIVGKGGKVGFGKFGAVGRGGVCRRWRAAKETWTFENDKAMKKARMKHLKEAIFKSFSRVFEHTDSVMICEKTQDWYMLGLYSCDFYRFGHLATYLVGKNGEHHFFQVIR
ncbi:unnamed protein product [Dovyalis caffra]|uniref:Uncharacterized protein n=1 Tax=Dovyalis caffra TaxID=77055 RepID=A0AAV1QTU5_9ROSI|nr:unnamed protein product [Dovyalis caffra]